MNKSASVVVLLVALTLGAAGCATPQRLPLSGFYQYDYPFAVKGFREEIKYAKEKQEQNIVLANINYAGAAFVGGDYQDSLAGFHAAAQIMEDVAYGAERGQAAMVLSHAMRVFKGEPYERAMAYTYMGLIYFRRGDLENARAAFNLALLADRSSKGENEDYRDDFTLAHYFIGKTYLKLGEADNAGISFNKVRKYMTDNPFADPAQSKDANVTLLVEMGCGPSKRPDPVVGSVDVIVACQYPERYAEVYVDGATLGRTAKLVDLNHQAKTSGSSSRDVAQAAKGIAVAIVKQIPFVGILGSVAEMGGVNKADLRHWALMPGEVHVLEAKVPPGLHTLQLKFFDAKGKELERYQQTYYYVPIRESSDGKGEQVYVVRSGLDRHNEIRPLAADYLAIGPGFANQQFGFGGEPATETPATK